MDGRLVDGRAVMTPMTFGLPLGAGTGGKLGGAKTGGAADGRPLVFGIRPEDVFLESGAPVEALVHDVENHGVEKIVTLRVGDAHLRATVPAQTAVTVDAPVRFGWNADKVALFDRGSGVSLRHGA
jgi:multiple sugar transport system ATP-binding protein